MCRGADITVYKLRVDLTASMHRVRNVQEQLDRQTVLLSGKGQILQSITGEPQVAHVRLKNAKNKIARLNVKLQRGRDLRPSKTKELLEEQVWV